MPVQIGSKAHSFSEPMALLSDCHRRIEMFLGSLVRAGQIIGQPLDDEAKAGLDSSLTYFREAAPKHTADEEESLFPRMRQTGNAEVTNALGKLAALEQDHRRADALHAEVDSLGSRAIVQGLLGPDEADRFRKAVNKLAEIYKNHIQLEDQFVFPIAARALGENDKNAIAAEMAARRHVRGV